MQVVKTSMVLFALIGTISSSSAAKTDFAKAPQVIDWTIGNGLRVLLLPRPGAPSVAVQIFYHAGSKDEVPTRRGIAHLFEHMMFKGTARVPPEAYARYINQLGGANNAFTTDDLTAYEEVIPPPALDFTLALEADRMRGLSLSQQMLDSEREVVKEELRMRVENNPIMQGVERIMGLAYTTHPYRVMTIGNKEMLDAVTVEDCRRYYDLYYQPNNATLVIVGAADETEARALVERHFGKIARGPVIVRQVIEEPPQTSLRQAELQLPMELPVVLGAYHVPGAAHPDLYPLAVLQEILSSGESSRLYRRLVRGGLGVFAGGFLFDHEEPSLFVTFAQLIPNGDPKLAQAAFDEEMARVTREKVTAAELTKAKNQLATHALFERERSQGLATAIGSAALMKNDPLAPFSDLRHFDAVTADQVLAVAKKYLVAQNQTTLALRPRAHGSAAPAPDAVRPEPPAPVAKSEPVTNVAPLRPPVDLPVPALSLGEVVRLRLPNGMKLLVVPRHDLPLVHVSLALQAGNLDAPLERMGLAELTAEMLRKGAGTRGAVQIADLVDGAGADLRVQVDDEETLVGCQARVGDLSLCLSLLADLAMRPSFPEGELKEARAELLAHAVQDVRDNPQELAHQHAANEYFGDLDPRGRPISERSVQAIQRKDLTAFHAARYRPDAAVLVVAGDVDVAALKALLNRAGGLARWAKKGTLPSVARPLPAPRSLHVRLVDKPDATQTSLVLVGPGLAHRDPDLFAFEYVNYILGGGDFSSRLMQRIRSEGGKAYGVSSTFDKAREPGAFVVSTATRVSESGQTLKLIFSEIDKMKKAGPTLAELKEARGNLVGRLAISLETGSDVGRVLLRALLDGLPDDFTANAPAQLAAVSLDAVRRAAATHLGPEALVAVGPAEAVRPLLQALGFKIGDAIAAEAPVSAIERAAH